MKGFLLLKGRRFSKAGVKNEVEALTDLYNWTAGPAQKITEQRWRKYGALMVVSADRVYLPEGSAAPAGRSTSCKFIIKRSAVTTMEETIHCQSLI